MNPTAVLTQPVENQSTRQLILDAAERLFGDGGFDGTSMRAIAQSASVAQGLLHYHFDTKAKLFEQVVMRRTSAINTARLEALAQSDKTKLEPILDAVFRPALGADAGGVHYARILATIANGGDLEQDLVAKNYDDIAKTFIAAIKRAEPDLTQETAAWGYSLAIALLVSAMARTGRGERLAGQTKTEDANTTLARLVTYAAGGIRALASSG